MAHYAAMGVGAAIVITLGRWSDQSFEGMMANWLLYLVLPVIVLLAANFTSTFGAKKASGYQTSKQ